MSPPAFLDSSTGQFSSFESLSRFGSCYNNMNSSSSNSNHGFSNLNEANPILGFNSPPLAASGSGSNLSRPRLVKMRRQASSLKHRSSSPDLGPGFNHFGSSSESVLGNLSSGNVEKEPFWLGANRGMNLSSYSDSERRVSSGSSNVILDGMRKLKIGLDKDYDLDHANAIENHDAFKLKAFESENKKSFADELPKEISKLKIEDMSNLGNRKNFQCIDPVNKTQFTNFVNDNVGVELQNEMKKMNLNHPGDVYIGSKNFKSSEKKVDFGFTSKLDDMGAPPVEFKVPDMKSNLFSGVDVFEAKRESVKDTRLKKKKGKLRKPIVGQSRIREDLGFSGRISLENQETFEAYSPMDISPYQETLADNYSRGTSVTSEEGYQTDQDLLDAVQCLDINVNHGDGESCLARDEVFEPQMNEVSETESFKSATENLEFVSDNTFVTALDSEVSSTATSGFKFASKLENSNTCKDGFTFAAFSSSQSQLPPDTRQHKKKHRLKTVHDSYSAKPDSKNLYISSPSAEFFPISGNSSILSPGKGQKVDISPLLSKQKDNSISKPVNEQGVKHGTVVTSSGSNLAQEACEKWRLRGNQAYGNGDLAKAEDYYTQGLNSISESEISRSYLRAMMLCYSNRAATRISLGRMREALEDCLMAAKIDPNFLKVRVRAAHCYLAVGEVENATREFMKCLQSESDVIMDRKLMAEVSEGLEKAKKVSNCITQYTDLTQRRTSEDLERALRFIDEALLISTFSEKLLQMKADALLMLRKYEQVIQVCEWTLSLDTPTSSSSRLWISSLIVKSYFYLGKLDEALEFIKKQENSQITEGVGNTSQESVIPLADTVRELLSHKAAGNEAYKSGKHAEAVEHYTAVLSCNVESWPFSAICFCNRAAAYRALGQITDAIADCSLAIALDPNYLKAISRRAGLYEMIRDYGQAAIDIQRVVSLLTKQVEEKVSDKISCMNELKQTQLQLSNMEEESRKGIPLNMYLILGIESSASGPDIKKAYRRAALKHHPDKAGQSLSRSDNGDDGLWKEIAENVHKDADRLFKMIGEAYALLSNPSKRSRYDVDEEMRKEANNRFSRRNSSDGQNTRQDYSWRPYGNTQSKASEKTASSYKYSRYP